MVDGDIRDRDDESFPQRGLGGGAGSFRGAKRTKGIPHMRGITGIGGGNYNASNSSSNRDRMDMDSTF